MNTTPGFRAPINAAHTPEDLRRKFAVGLIIAIGTAIVIALWVLSAWSSTQIGWDFPVFYIAGRLPIKLLYSRTAFAGYWQHHLAPLGVPHWAPYVRPSVFSFLLCPLATLPYFQALCVWLAAGLAAYFAAIGLMIRRFRLPGLLLTAYAGFFPAIAGTLSGADATFFLLAMVIALLLLERNRDALAAIALTACLCKFNLVLLVPVLLVLHRRYLALCSLAVGGISVAAASTYFTPVSEYFTAIIGAQRNTPGFYPVGLRGFSVAIGQPWLYPALSVLALLFCCWLMKRLAITEGFCVAVTGALLISPYVCWYDSTLLALPLAVIFARSGLQIRVACTAILVAMPLWTHGGGNNGPIGFMHVSVETLILTYFANAHRIQVKVSHPSAAATAEAVA
jgi:hypothetical protein